MQTKISTHTWNYKCNTVISSRKYSCLKHVIFLFFTVLQADVVSDFTFPELRTLYFRRIRHTGKNKSEIRQIYVHISSWIWAGDRRVRATKDGRSKYLKLRDHWDGLRALLSPIIVQNLQFFASFRFMYLAALSMLRFINVN